MKARTKEQILEILKEEGYNSFQSKELTTLKIIAFISKGFVEKEFMNWYVYQGQFEGRFVGGIDEAHEYWKTKVT